MFRSKAPTPARRRPHPDPRVEAQLQRVLSLQQVVARGNTLLDQYHADVAGLQARIGKRPASDGASGWRRQVRHLNSEIARLNEEVRDTHDQVDALMQQLSDDELLWLSPGPRNAMTRRGT